MINLFQVALISSHDFQIQLLNSFPVLLLRWNNTEVIVNIEELVTSPDSFSSFITLDGVLEAPYSSVAKLKPDKPKSDKNKLSSMSGRPLHITRFP